MAVVELASSFYYRTRPKPKPDSNSKWFVLTTGRSAVLRGLSQLERGPYLLAWCKIEIRW